VTLAEDQAVVLVHGLWMTGLDMLVLGRRLRRAGYRVRHFRYRSVRRGPGENAARLAQFVERIDAPVVHYVAHSLGGIVLLYLYERYPPAKPGRVVLLGSPVTGSSSAERLRRRPLGRWMLGRSWRGGLDGNVPEWDGRRELGVIAGTLGAGPGRLSGNRMPVPHDGTVALAETRLAGASDRLEVRATHMGLLFTPRVARAVAGFLREGRFAPQAR